MRHIGSALIAMLVLTLLVGVAHPQRALADGERILIYTGNDAYAGTENSPGNATYERFAQAVGKPADSLETMPTDLSPYACIVLSLNTATFDGPLTSQIVEYVNGGGVVLGIGENTLFVNEYPDTNAVLNGVATALGSSLSITTDILDPTFHVTTNIDPATLTAGVSSIVLAASSEISIATDGNGESLVRSTEGTTVVAADSIGNGRFVLSGDSNIFSDNSEDGYTAHDNGVLAANICDGLYVEPPPVSYVRACLYAGTLSQVGTLPEGQADSTVTCGRGEAILLVQGDDYTACLFAGSLSQVGSTTACGRGELIGLAAGDAYYACLYAGSLSRVGTSEPICGRGVVIGFASLIVT